MSVRLRASCWILQLHRAFFSRNIKQLVAEGQGNRASCTDAVSSAGKGLIINQHIHVCLYRWFVQLYQHSKNCCWVFEIHHNISMKALFVALGIGIKLFNMSAKTSMSKGFLAGVLMSLMLMPRGKGTPSVLMSISLDSINGVHMCFVCERLTMCSVRRAELLLWNMASSCLMHLQKNIVMADMSYMQSCMCRCRNECRSAKGRAQARAGAV